MRHGLISKASHSPERALQEMLAGLELDDEDLRPTRESLGVALESAWSADTIHERGLQALLRYWSSNLARAEALAGDRRRFPDIGSVEVAAPLVVAGQPRSGTTFLHALLAQDPANRSIATWEAEFPSPPPSADTATSDRRIAEWTILHGGDLASPGKDLKNLDLQAKHLMEPTLPDECGAIMASTTRTLGAWSIAPLAPYMHWWMQADLRHPYRAHRRWLQHLQWRHSRERWVLKYPAHMAALPYLFAEYPDARVVQTHRRLDEVISSLTSLFLSLRKDTTASQDPQATAREILDHIRIISEKTLAFRRNYPQAPVIDVSYNQLLGDPIGTVQRIYTAFSIPFTSEAEQRMRVFLQDFPQGKKGRHDHALETNGLSSDVVSEVNAHYIRRFEAFL